MTADQTKLENRRLARSIRDQKPFYSASEMDKAESQRQALLKTMSRAQRRKDRVAFFAAASGAAGSSATKEEGAPPEPGTRHANRGRSKSSLTEISRLVADGVVFRPGPSAVKLRTARQMREEVARRRGGSGGGGGEESYSDDIFSDGAAATKSRESRDVLVVTGSVGGRGLDNGDGRVVLEAHRTGGYSKPGGGGSKHAMAEEGRPNLIFTPSLMPVGADRARAHPIGAENHCRGATGVAGATSSPDGPEVKRAPATTGGSECGTNHAGDNGSSARPRAGRDGRAGEVGLIGEGLENIGDTEALERGTRTA